MDRVQAIKELCTRYKISGPDAAEVIKAFEIEYKIMTVEELHILLDGYES